MFSSLPPSCTNQPLTNRPVHVPLDLHQKKKPMKPAGLCQGNHFLLPKNDRLLCLRETSLRENRLGGELRAHTCAIVDEKCFRIYSDRYSLCCFESILMLARNDMINEGSRTNLVTGARKIGYVPDDTKLVAGARFQNSVGGSVMPSERCVASRNGYIPLSPSFRAQTGCLF